MPELDHMFSRRFNCDGTIDSICHRCFMTIGTVVREADLESIERQHHCSPEDKLRSEVLREEAKLSA